MMTCLLVRCMILCSVEFHCHIPCKAYYSTVLCARMTLHGSHVTLQGARAVMSHKTLSGILGEAAGWPASASRGALQRRLAGAHKLATFLLDN